MKTKTKKTTPSVAFTSPAAVGSGFTLGLDLGDRSHYVCVLDATGQFPREGPLLNYYVKELVQENYDSNFSVGPLHPS